jgi:hypothetical protein
LLVIGDRQALAWILTSQRMAFTETRASTAQRLQPDDKLLLYTTRGCFRSPVRDRGRVIGEATVNSAVTRLADPVTFGERSFPVGCSMTLHRLTHFRTGVELAEYVRQMHTFRNPDVWSVYLRRTLVALDDHDYDLLIRPLNEIAVTPSQAVSEYTARSRNRAAGAIPVTTG